MEEKKIIELKKKAGSLVLSLNSDLLELQKAYRKLSGDTSQQLYEKLKLTEKNG